MLGVNAWQYRLQHRRVSGGFLLPFDRPLANRQLSAVLLFPVNHFAAFVRKIAERSMDSVRWIIPMSGLAGLPFAIVGVVVPFQERPCKCRARLYVRGGTDIVGALRGL